MRACPAAFWSARAATYSDRVRSVMRWRPHGLPLRTCPKPRLVDGRRGCPMRPPGAAANGAARRPAGARWGILWWGGSCESGTHHRCFAGAATAICLIRAGSAAAGQLGRGSESAPRLRPLDSSLYNMGAAGNRQGAFLRGIYAGAWGEGAARPVWLQT